MRRHEACSWTWDKCMGTAHARPTERCALLVDRRLVYPAQDHLIAPAKCFLLLRPYERALLVRERRPRGVRARTRAAATHEAVVLHERPVPMRRRLEFGGAAAGCSTLRVGGVPPPGACTRHRKFPSQGLPEPRLTWCVSDGGGLSVVLLLNQDPRVSSVPHRPPEAHHRKRRA